MPTGVAYGALGMTEASRIHMVWTRKIDGEKMVGRIKMAQATRSAIRFHYPNITESVLRPITDGISVYRIISVIIVFLASFMRALPLPLQCILFGDPAEARRIIEEIPPDCAAVYLDGARCVTLMDLLRRKRPNLAIITDLDDLMSRRMALMLDLKQAPSTGYLKKSMPVFVEILLNSKLFSQLLLRYERWSLKCVEQRIVLGSDLTVLISGVDALALRRDTGSENVVGLPIPVPVMRDAKDLLPDPLRFIFVGTDTLRQNQLTIDKIVSLWINERIEAPLVIYGEQSRSINLPESVTMPGYTQSLEQIYDGRSILISPSYLAGGLKTKVVEAFGFGSPVLGNEITFEGVDIVEGYPLLFSDIRDAIPLIRDPESFRPALNLAAKMGHQIIRAKHDPDRFKSQWGDMVAQAISRHHIRP
jgi:hypothetical protein